MNSCGVEAPACPADAGGKYFWLCTGKSPAGFISHVSCASRPGLHHACIPFEKSDSVHASFTGVAQPRRLCRDKQGAFHLEDTEVCS